MAYLGPNAPEGTALYSESVKKVPSKPVKKKRLSDFAVAFKEARREAVKRGADPRTAKFAWRGKTFTTRYATESASTKKAAPSPKPTSTSAPGIEPISPRLPPQVKVPKSNIGKGVAVGAATGAAAGGAAYAISKLRKRSIQRTSAKLTKALPQGTRPIQLPSGVVRPQLSTGYAGVLARTTSIPQRSGHVPKQITAGSVRPSVVTEEFGPSMKKWAGMSMAQRRASVTKARKGASIAAKPKAAPKPSKKTKQQTKSAPKTTPKPKETTSPTVRVRPKKSPSVEKAATRRTALAKKAAKLAKNKGVMAEADAIVAQADKELAARGMTVEKPTPVQPQESSSRFKTSGEVKARKASIEEFMKKHPEKVKRAGPTTLKEVAGEAASRAKKTLVKKAKKIGRKAASRGSKLGSKLGPVGVILGGIYEAEEAKRQRRRLLGGGET